MTESLTYRLCRPEDMPALLRLWEEEAGWGKLSEETWRQWFIDSSQGPALVVVAARPNGEVVAQQVYSPARVLVEDRVVKALHFSAPIVRSDIRAGLVYRADHLLVQLYEYARKEAQSQEFGLIYAQPKHAWLRFVRSSPYFTEAEYPCVERAMLPPPGNADRLKAASTECFRADHEDVWNSARKSFPVVCGVARTPSSLNFRYGGHLVLEVHDPQSHRLCGYVALRKNTGLMDDVVADRPDRIAAVLASTLDYLASHPEVARPFGLSALQAMATPFLQDALDALGFKPIRFMFAFICDVVDPSLPKEAAEARRWYVTPGD